MSGAHAPLPQPPMWPPDVIGPAEAVKLLGVNRARFYQLAARPDFPPARELANGKVYDGPQMRAYALQRELGRPVLEALAVYQSVGTIGAAARAASSDPSTVRRWLRKIRVPLPTER